MNLKSKIYKILERKGWKLNQLTSQLSMSASNLYKCFEKNNIMLQDLIEISSVLEVHPKTFFEDDDEIITVAREDKAPYANDDYIKCLEELREVYQENRDLHKRIRELEEKSGDKKIPCDEGKQKTTSA